MMKEELSLATPDPDEHSASVREALLMFVSFAGFGMVPIIGFAVVPSLCAAELS